MRRAASLLCLVGALLGTLGLLPARAQSGGPVVEVFEASGVLDDSVLGALRRDLDGAEERGARVFLVQLSSFGGLGVDPAEVQRTVAGAGVPVAVWVGPRSAEAAGTAAFLLAGADVVGVARDARVGPALPAELGRGRDPGAEAALLAESGLPAAVGRSRISGAAAEAAGLADYQAESLPDAVRRLDGQMVDGRPLEVTGFQVRFLSRSLLDRVRHGLANPTLAYLLLLAAAACLSFEWFQPGAAAAGRRPPGRPRGAVVAGLVRGHPDGDPPLPAPGPDGHRGPGRLPRGGAQHAQPGRHRGGRRGHVAGPAGPPRGAPPPPPAHPGRVRGRGHPPGRARGPLGRPPVAAPRPPVRPGRRAGQPGLAGRCAGGRAPGSVQGTPAPAVPRLPTAAWCCSSWSPGCCSAASAGG